jgi:hypothetical protein
MTTRVDITCIVRSDRFRAHERILSIGGRRFDGKPWMMSQDGAIRGIEEGKYFFYINKAGNVINVIVAISPQGHKYLKTFADGEQPNSLLSLPECPH